MGEICGAIVWYIGERKEEEGEQNVQHSDRRVEGRDGRDGVRWRR